jgi:hypothetical protein
MKLSFIVYQLKFYIEMPFCPTPMDMFLVAAVIVAVVHCLREYRHNHKGKELIV